MSKVYFELSMSLDGFVAGPNDGPDNPMGDGGERLFRWYSLGDTDFPLPGTDMVFKISRASADFLRPAWLSIGASVVGRRTFDIAKGWGGRPPGGGPHFVVTHTVPQAWAKPGSLFTFVTDGVESAVAQAKAAAGGKNIDLVGAQIAQQCLRAGLVDELQVDLVPVLLGGGVRLFEQIGLGPMDLEPLAVVEGVGVTHLRYRVIKPTA